MIELKDLSASRQDYTPIEIEPESNKVNRLALDSIALYLGAGSANIPGMSNLIYSPLELVEAGYSAYDAYQINDTEGLYESGVKVVQSLFCIVQAILQTTWNFLFTGKFFHFIADIDIWLLTGSPLSREVAALGFVVCAIEGVLETVGLVRTIKFFKENYSSELQELKETLQLSDSELKQTKLLKCLQKILQAPFPEEIKNEIDTYLANNELNESDLSNQFLIKIEESYYLEKAKNIQAKFFEISSEEQLEIEEAIQESPSENPQLQKQRLTEIHLKRKKNELIRKVHPWLATRIEESLPDLIKNLQSIDPCIRDEAREKALSLFNNIKIQSEKKMIVHSTGLVAIAFTIAGLILSCFALPLGIAIAFLTIGSALGFTRYCMYYGWMDCEGWKFSAYNCIPNFIRKFYEERFLKQAADPITVAPPVYTPHTLQFTIPQQHRRKLPRLNYSFSVPASEWKA